MESIENNELFLELMEKYTNKSKAGDQIRCGNFELFRETYFFSEGLEELKEKKLLIKLKESFYPIEKKEYQLDFIEKGKEKLVFLGENEEEFKEKVKELLSIKIGSRNFSFDVLKVFEDQQKKGWIEESRCIEFPTHECYHILSHCEEKEKRRDKLIALLLRIELIKEEELAAIELQKCGKWKSHRYALANQLFKKINRKLIEKKQSEKKKQEEKEMKQKQKEMKVKLYARINGEERGVGDHFVGIFKFEKKRMRETLSSFRLFSPFFKWIELEIWKLLKKKKKNPTPINLFGSIQTQRSEKTTNKNKFDRYEECTLQIEGEGGEEEEEEEEEGELKVLLLREKALGMIRGCDIENTLLYVEGNEIERSLQYFPMISYAPIKKSKHFKRFFGLIQKSASLGNPIALMEYRSHYMDHQLFVEGKKMFMAEYFIEKAQKEEGFFDQYDDLFVKATLHRDIGDRKLASHYFEKDSSFHLSKCHYYQINFLGRKLFEKMKELSYYSLEARKYMPDISDTAFKEQIKTNIAGDLESYFLINSKNQSITKKDKMEALVKAFLLGSMPSAYYLLKHFKIDPYFFEKKFGKISSSSFFPNTPTLVYPGFQFKKKVKPISKKMVSKNTTSKNLISKNTISKTPISKTTISKTPISKTPISKTTISKTPTSKTPTSKTPISKTPTSKTPISKNSISKNSISKTPISKTPISKTPISKNTISKNSISKTQTQKVSRKKSRANKEISRKTNYFNLQDCILKEIQNN